MDPFLTLAAGCVLQIVETDLQRTEAGWVEQSHVEVAADPGCAWVEWPLPPGVFVESTKGRTRLGDGTSKRTGADRWVLSPRSVQGHSSVRVFLPELLQGDRVELDLRRTWPPGPWVMAPGPARYLVLKAPGVDPSPHLDVGEDLRLEVPDSRPAPSPEPVSPAADVRQSRRIELLVPSGDPLLSLYPGAGSATRVEELLSFHPSEAAQTWTMPRPAEEVTLYSQPEGAATLRLSPDTAVVTVGPSEGPSKVTLVWEQADAPTFGERGPYDKLIVDVLGGSVDWEGDGWRLVQLSNRAVLPSRRALVKALDHRFRAAVLPEPGMPMSLRGQRVDLALAERLLPAMLERVAVATWPTEALWPRKLSRARKSGVVTPTEAMLLLWVYAKQAGLSADWALARPAHTGPGYRNSPAGADHPLLQLKWAGQDYWVDPTCEVCGPFELPPDLEGATVVGPRALHTPPPREGLWRVTREMSGTTWTLEGPAALDLRLWLQSLPPASRTAALAERVGGPQAKLIETTGVEVAGGEITLRTGPYSTLVTDPTVLPTPNAQGTAWFPWVGVRELHLHGVSLPPVQVVSGPLTFERSQGAEGVVERLVVNERLVQAEDLRVIEQARATP